MRSPSTSRSDANSGLPEPSDHQDGVIYRAVGTERRARDLQPHRSLEPLRPSAVPRSRRARPTSGGLPLEDHVGRYEAAPEVQEPSEQRTGDGVRRVGDDPEGAPRGRRSAPSAWTTVTCRMGNRRRRSAARPGWSSIATTRAPAARRAAVTAPVPAPTSRTSSPRRTSAWATRRSAQEGSSWCHPHRREPAGTADHDRHHEK